MSHFAPYIQSLKNELIVAQDECFIAIVEAQPLALGHCVVFPKRVEDSWTDLSDDELAGAMKLARKVAKAIEKAYPCKKVGMAVLGLAVRHAHIHLVPLQSADDLNFTRKKLEPTAEELSGSALKIRSFF